MASDQPYRHGVHACVAAAFVEADDHLHHALLRKSGVMGLTRFNLNNGRSGQPPYPLVETLSFTRCHIMALLSIYSIVTEFDPRADYSVGLPHASLENPSMRRRGRSNNTCSTIDPELLVAAESPLLVTFSEL